MDDPVPAPSTPSVEAVFGSVASKLKLRHMLALAKPIVGPDEYGWFSTGALPVLPPVVLDANVLDRDLTRAAARGERTVLVNAANSESLRLFCAQHVLEEVAEHAPKFARRANVSLSEYLRC